MDAEQLAQLVVNTRAQQVHFVMLVTMVTYYMQHGGVTPSVDHPTCKQFVKNLQRGENKRITLAIVGMEAFERYHMRLQ